MRHDTFHKTSWTVLLAACLLLASGSVRAQTTASQPWSAGVSPQQQQRAETLYQEGNRDFVNGFFASAVTKYQAALRHWNHPGIHYNLALALISLGRPIEAYESVVAALSHGTDGLHPEEYQRALDHKRALRQQIAAVDVVCDEPGAAVTLDGKLLFNGPGRVTTMVLPGRHQVVASKTGHLTTTRAFTLAGGARSTVELRLALMYPTSLRTERRWPSWTHWAVTGLGLSTGAAAAAMHWRFDVHASRLTAAWTEACAAGCDTYPDTLSPLRDRVELHRNMTYAGYATAGVLLAAGAALTYFNRLRSVNDHANRASPRVSISPGGPESSPGVSIHMPF
jgi:hypothetical protein